MGRTLILLLGVLLMTPSHADDAAYGQELLRLTEACRAAHERAAEHLQVAPVILPRGKHRLGHNRHYGWPVATMTGESIIMACYRKPAHWGGGKADQNTSRAVLLRSTDGGQTWGEPLNLAEVGERQDGCKHGFGNAIGVDTEGRPIIVCNYGVFRSPDAGRTWAQLPKAYGGEQLTGKVCNHGPRLIVHPDKGLVVAGHAVQSGKKNPDGTPYVPPELWLRTSADNGETWTEQKVDLPEFATPIEPTLLYHDGGLLVVARCHGRESLEPKRQTWRYVQLWSETGWAPFQAKLTNIRTTDTGTPYGGPWSQDTVDLCYNPVSERLECVATNRTGGGPGHEQDDVQTLNLWSIAPAQVATAQWRFEATLLTRDGGMWKGKNDGLHPGGAVLDHERGVQHIFIYAGRPQAPSGIFRVTRTLDTAKLVAALREEGP